MKLLKFIFRFVFVSIISFALYFLIIKFFNSIFISDSLIFPYALHPFDLNVKIPTAWHYIKLIFKISLIFNLIVLLNSLFSYLFPNKRKNKSKHRRKQKSTNLSLLIGRNSYNSPFFINDKGLFQNVLITGTIGSGKTSSVMYPFCRQLIFYSKDNLFKKIGMLILDVKGNFYKQILEYAREANRLDDVIVIEIKRKI